MDVARFAQLQSMFDRLRDLPAAEQQQRLAAEAAADPALLAEVERLLQIDRELPPEPEPPPVLRSMPANIGPYRVLAELGHGGMGTVYKAEQLEPVRRLLAIKVVQAGLGTKEVLARFHIERKALAAMNHRHIAKVFDAGATEQGQPYFAMELVEGEPLGDYCDRHRLSLPQRLRLFQQICDGVQHAHQKGVVHRDLKPGNVLVATEGQEPVPKIVDFGLAKATDRDFVDVTLMTEKDQVLGTYEYMSPEQAHGDSERVDARADVYSLGVVLYELLCGELPFSTDMLRKSGRLEALRLIREQEPGRPSARLSAHPDREALAALRQTTVPALHKELRRDLDWVVQKAMAKEPERRYQAATLLAADLQRHLDFEPVLATPPSVGYRLQKFVRRYRVQCLAAAAVAVAIVVGAIGFAGKLAADRAEMHRNRVFADAALLADAQGQEATLHPAWPDRIAAMLQWLAVYGEPLAARLPDLQRDLAALRAKAQPLATDAQAAAADAASRRRLQSQLAGEDSELRRAELADQLRQIDLAAEVRGFGFGVSSEALLHRTLTQLVRDLERFVAPSGPLAAVRARLERAATVAAQTITAVRPQWDAAIAAIAASDGVTASARYDHLAIAPQVGLVPLGMDPVSKLWEFVHLASGTPGRETPARDAATGRLLVTGDSGVVFVLLPGGRLPVADGGTAQPRHAQQIDAFFLGKYELTRGQLRRLARLPAVGGNEAELALPAQWLSWFDCRDLLAQEAWLLPTELQWEYGCRGGTSTPWWTGDRAESLVGKESPRNAKRFHPVGSWSANPFGLFDTLGNAWEWCRDERPLVLLGEAKATAQEAAFGADLFVYHAGSFDLNTKNLGDPANRTADDFGVLSPATRFHNLGVRPMRPLLP